MNKFLYLVETEGSLPHSQATALLCINQPKELFVSKGSEIQCLCVQHV